MRRCDHGHAGNCPEDRVCQVRLRAETVDPGPWQTHSIYACWSELGVAEWRRQVAPVLRRRGYETRVVRAGELES